MTTRKPSSSSEFDTRERQLTSLLSAAQREISAADAKAGLMLAAIGVGASAFLSGMLSATWSPASLGRAGQILWWAGALGFGVAVGFLGSAIYPRIPHAVRRSGGTSLFFGEAARHKSVADLLRHLEDSGSYLTALGEDAIRVLRIARTKHTQIRAALWAAAAASLLLVISMITSSWLAAEF